MVAIDNESIPASPADERVELGAAAHLNMKSRARGNLRKALAQHAVMGVQVEFFAAPDSCPVCQVIAGKLFDPRSAPEIPVLACDDEYCRCDYLPVRS